MKAESDKMSSHEKHVNAGRKGGLARSKSCTTEQIQEWGRIGGLKGGHLGGRPRLPTLSEVIANMSPKDRKYYGF